MPHTTNLLLLLIHYMLSTVVVIVDANRLFNSCLVGGVTKKLEIGLRQREEWKIIQGYGSESVFAKQALV